MTTIFRHKISFEEYDKLEPWGRRIMVENISYSETMDSLLTAFGQFGLITELTYVPMKRQAFVVFATRNAAVLAVENTESMQFTSDKPNRPVNSTPAKDVAVVTLNTTRPGVTVAALEDWLNRVNDPGAVTDVKYVQGGKFLVCFRAHYLAYRFHRKIKKNEINLTPVCGRNATVEWPEIPIYKLKTIPLEVTGEQIRNAFRSRLRESLFDIARRGVTVYVYFKDYSSYNRALELHPDGIDLIVNGNRSRYPLYKLDKQEVKDKQ